MADLKDFFRFNEIQQDRLNKLADPLRTYFGIDTFWYATLRKDGLYTNVCNYIEPFFQFFDNNWSGKIDYLGCPSGLKSGYTFLDYNPNFSRFQEAHKHQILIHHVFLILRKDKAGNAYYLGLSSKKPNPLLPSLYVNHLPLLNKFLDHVIQNFQKDRGLLEEGSINLAEEQGPDVFYGKKYPKETCTDSYRNCKFLSSLGVNKALFSRALLLSEREREVLASCVAGNTASQIADQLLLSRRTVEHYLDKIKEKLDLPSKKELIQCGRLLAEAGFCA